MLDELTEFLRLENCQRMKKCFMKLLAETRLTLTAATYTGVKTSWVCLREEKTIWVRKQNEQSGSPANLRTELKACNEIVLINITRAGKS